MFLKLAFRELLRSWRFGLFFIFNLSLGLTGFVSLEAFKSAIQANIEKNSKAILSADIAVSARRPITEAEHQKILQAVGPEAQESLTYEFFAMLSTDKTSRLVMVKAIDRHYPFYGKMELGSGQIVDLKSEKNILGQPAAWIYPELQTQMDVKMGDQVRLGQLVLRLADTVEKDGTQTFRMASLAPRIFVDRELLPQSGLIQYGSTYSTNYLYKLPENTNVDALKEKLFDVLTDPAIQVETPETAGEASGRQLAYLSDYLGLVAIIALFMSVLGASYIYRLYLSRKMKEIAVYRTLGLQSESAIGLYVIQVLILGLLASVPTLLLTSIVLPMLSQLLQRFASVELVATITPAAFLICVLMAVLGSFLICLPFLLKIKELRPAKLFSEEKFSADVSIRHIWSFIPAILVFWLLAVYQAHSWSVGTAFIGALAGVLVLLGLIAWVGLQSLSYLNFFRVWFVKFSLLGLRRRKSASFAVFIAIGLGSLLMNILPQLKTTLQAEFRMDDKSKLPSLFMFDIQDEQIAPLLDVLHQHNIENPVVSPMVRGRILKINDQDYERKLENIKFQTREEEREARFRNRGVNLSYRAQLSEAEILLAGRAFSGIYDSNKQKYPELSLEYKYAERIGIKLGDIMTFDVQGVEVQGQVISFRKVKWTSFQPNFFVLVQDGVLNEAPKTLILSVPSMSADRKVELQNEVTQKFANISMIDVARTVEDVMGVANQMSWSLELMAALALLTGYIVLFSITRAQLQQRRWELNMLKILGSSWKQVSGFILTESFSLTLLSATAGAVLSILVSYSLAFYVFEADFKFELFWPVISVISITAVSLLVAFLAGLDIVREKPLKILRNEN